MDTVHDLYERQVKPLSVSERLELMQLIMQDLARSTARWTVEAGDVWSDEDLNDLSQASLAYASARLLNGEKDGKTG
jgi:hypothetical protein